jgi:hypothetical protein
MCSKLKLVRWEMDARLACHTKRIFLAKYLNHPRSTNQRAQHGNSRPKQCLVQTLRLPLQLRRCFTEEEMHFLDRNLSGTVVLVVGSEWPQHPASFRPESTLSSLRGL